MRNIIICIAILLIVWSCGSSAPQPTKSPENPPESSVESEIDSDEMQEVVSESDAEGPASLTILVSVDRQTVDAQIKLFDQNGQLVAEGNSGQKLNIQSGNYSANIQVLDGKIMIDKPTKVQEFTLVKGADVTEQVTIPWSKIRLNVKINGKLNRKAKIDLIRDGSVVASIVSAATKFVTISPGRYQADVKLGKSVTRVDDVMFPEGATIDVPVNVSF